MVAGPPQLIPHQCVGGGAAQRVLTYRAYMRQCGVGLLCVGVGVGVGMRDWSAVGRPRVRYYRAPTHAPVVCVCGGGCTMSACICAYTRLVALVRGSGDPAPGVPVLLARAPSRWAPCDGIGKRRLYSHIVQWQEPWASGTSGSINGKASLSGSRGRDRVAAARRS